MKHYIATPFSIATDLQYSQKIGNRKSWDRHIAPLIESGMSIKDAHITYLYSNERMKYRFNAFKKICVHRMHQATKSLKNDDWKWLIYTTDCMPTAYFEELELSVQGLESTEIRKLPYGEPLSKMAIDFANVTKEVKSRFSTTRLDDDDGLPFDIFERVRHFAEKNHTLSFTQILK